MDKPKQLAVIAAFIVMLLMHQDFWLWKDDTLVMGYMPVGLFYHAVFSIFCGVLGWAAIKYAWPEELEKKAMDDEPESKS